MNINTANLNNFFMLKIDYRSCSNEKSTTSTSSSTNKDKKPDNSPILVKFHTKEAIGRQSPSNVKKEVVYKEESTILCKSFTESQTDKEKSSIFSLTNSISLKKAFFDSEK